MRSVDTVDRWRVGRLLGRLVATQETNTVGHFMTEVLCKYWEDCGSNSGGRCSAGVFERPSFGVCNNLCKYNTNRDNFEPIKKLNKKQPLHKRIVKQIGKYIEAEASLANEGALDDQQYGARIKVCLVCEHLKQTYDDIGHCGACGCGISKRAALTVKGRMAGATCPKDKWAAVQMKPSEE